MTFCISSGEFFLKNKFARKEVASKTAIAFCVVGQKAIAE